jgi:hypothetical protein
MQDIFFHSDVVMHYSTVALIQRAVSPDSMSFNQECLEASRAALVAHMRANAQFNKKGQEELWSGYVHWSILQAPFTPYVLFATYLITSLIILFSFIVIFCNAIQKADSSDLNSLSDFVASLESCRTISEGADKLYRMCHLFSQVAKLYIMAKTQDAAQASQSPTPNDQPGYYTTVDGTQLDMNAMSQFDPYLSALGLMPDSAWPMAGYNSNAPTADGMDAFSQGPIIDNTMNSGPMGMGLGQPTRNHNPLQDWFSGSRYLMNLMEAGDDIQMPDLEI